MTSTVHLLEMTGLIEERSVILREINQSISFSGISRENILKEILNIRCHVVSLADKND